MDPATEVIKTLDEKLVVEEKPSILLTKSSLDQGVLVSPQQAVDLPTEKVETIEGLISPKTQEAEEKVSESLARSVGELRPMMAGVRLYLSCQFPHIDCFIQESVPSDTTSPSVQERKVSSESASVKQHSTRARETVAFQARNLAQSSEAETVLENIDQQNLPSPADLTESVVRDRKEKPTQKPLELGSHSISQKVEDLKQETSSPEKVEPQSVGKKAKTVAEKVPTVLGTPDTSEKSSALKEQELFKRSLTAKVSGVKSGARENQVNIEVERGHWVEVEEEETLSPQSVPAVVTPGSSKAAKPLTETASLTSQTVGSLQPSEQTTRLEEEQLDRKTVRPVKVRGASSERVKFEESLQGVQENLEAPELFQDKFQPKSKTPKVLRESSTPLERPQLRDVSLSFLPETETSGDLSTSLPSELTPSHSETPSQLNNLLTKETRNIGVSRAVEVSGELEGKTMKTATANLKTTRSDSVERPQKAAKTLGFEPLEESAQSFNEKSEQKLSAAAAVASQPSVKEQSVRNVVTAGETERRESLGQVGREEKQSVIRVKTSTCRTDSVERAANLPRVVGEQGASQENCQQFQDRPEVKTSQAKSSRERSQSRETASYLARQEGTSLVREGAETLKKLSVTDHRAEEMTGGESKDMSVLSSNILGFQPATSEVDSLDRNLPREDRATVNQTDLNKKLAVNNERHLGSALIEEDHGDFEYFKPQEESSQVKNEESRLESSQYQSRSMGYDVESLDSRELPVKTQPEQSLSKISNTSALHRASSLVSRQGTSDMIESTTNIEPEEYKDQVARKLPRASSESRERAHCIPVRTGEGGGSREREEDLNESTATVGLQSTARSSQVRPESRERSVNQPRKLGFNSAPDTTQPLQTNLLGSAEASVKSETQRRDSVKRLSIVGGVSTEEDVLGALEDKPARQVKVSESLERKLSSERAASQGRLVGFVPQEERTEEERISTAAHREQTAQVSSSSSEGEKQRASYNIIEVGVDTSKETLTPVQTVPRPEVQAEERLERSGDCETERSESSESSSHRESRSRAVKKVRRGESEAAPLTQQDNLARAELGPAVLVVEGRLENQEEKKEEFGENTEMETEDTSEIPLKKENKKQKRRVESKVLTASEKDVEEAKPMEVEIDEKEPTKVEEEETAHTGLKAEAKDTTKQTTDKPIEMKEEKKPKLKKVIKPRDKDLKTEDIKTKDETENLPFGAKLRKTETVKRELEEAKLETVQLKHHQFEVTPRDADSEQTTGIILREPLVSLDEGGDALKKTDENKVEKKRKIKKQKKKEPETKEPVLGEPIEDVAPSDDNTKIEDEPKLPEKNIEPCPPEAKEVEDEIELQKEVVIEEPSDQKPLEMLDKMEVQEEELKSVTVDTVDTKKAKTEKPTEIKEEKPTLKKVIKPKEKDVKKSQKKDETEQLPFGTKLRKTETVKREIKEAKLETVQLKHHEFEVQPKDTDLEQTTGIVLGEPLVTFEESGDDLKKTDDKKGEKKRKIKKQKKKEPETKEPVVAEPIEDVVPSDDNTKIEDELPDKVEELSPPEATEAGVKIEVESEEEEVDMEEPFDQKRMEEDQKMEVPEETKKLKSVEVDTKKAKTEKPSKIKDEKPKLKKVIKPKAKDMKTEEEKKREEEEKLPFKAKLRKTETVKREIEESKIETVQLKHHQFEIQPKDTDVEQTTGIILGEPLVPLDEYEETLKKTDDSKGEKKRKIKKPKTKTPETKESIVPEETPSEKDDEPVVTKKKNSVPTEPETFSEVKLKTRKPSERPREETEQEKVVLKHHAFESAPCEEQEEMTSSVRLGKPLETPGGRKQPKKPREEKVATQLEVSEAEEMTDRKARDPIAQPAAAVTKKHSDTEKVELPAFLNFPSEQGIMMEESELEESETQRSPSSKVIAEMLHEETSEEKSPVIENQTMTRTNKTVKTVQKKKKSKPRIEESPLREIPILVERTKADDSVEPVTVPEPEVDLLFFLVLFLSKF